MNKKEQVIEKLLLELQKQAELILSDPLIQIITPTIRQRIFFSIQNSLKKEMGEDYDKFCNFVNSQGIQMLITDENQNLFVGFTKYKYDPLKPADFYTLKDVIESYYEGKTIC